MLRHWLRGWLGMRHRPSEQDAVAARLAQTGPVDDTPFGPDLARQAIRVLKTRRATGTLYGLVRLHRDYTGHGLYHETADGSFFVSASLDGLPQGAPLMTFADEAALTDWLARQSDLALSGFQHPNVFQNDAYAGNQRISREFLLSEIMRPPR